MSSMKLPSLFKSREAKQFDFKARYYDPEKEERDSRRRISEMEAQQDRGKMDPDDFRKLARERWKQPTPPGLQRAATIRLVIIALVLAFVAYYILLQA